VKNELAYHLNQLGLARSFISSTQTPTAELLKAPLETDIQGNTGFRLST